MSKPPRSGPHSDIDGLYGSAREDEVSRSRQQTGSASGQMQDHHQSKAKPIQNEQKPGGDGS